MARRPARSGVRTGVPAVALLFLLIALAPLPRAHAATRPPSADALAAQVTASETALRQAAARSDGLQAAAPQGAFATAQVTMQAGASNWLLRDAARNEEKAIYQLAADPGLAAQVEHRLGSQAPIGLPSVLAALRALWTLVGSTPRGPVYTWPYTAALPLPTLQGYYQGAAEQQGLDWTYLAAINFIESDFGRDTDVSSAGAQGPMQFLPSTWALYGNGGNILDPEDAIYAAAGYLAAMGAPQDYPVAIQRYDDALDYVAAVTDLAAAIRADGLWLERLYFWGTYG